MCCHSTCCLGWASISFFLSLSRSWVKIRLVLHSSATARKLPAPLEACFDLILPPFSHFQTMKMLFTNISTSKTGSSFDCFARLWFRVFCFVCNCHSGWQGVCFPFGNCEVTNRGGVYCEDVCCWPPESTQIYLHVINFDLATHNLKSPGFQSRFLHTFTASVIEIQSKETLFMHLYLMYNVFCLFFFLLLFTTFVFCFF